ncbi:MAG: hypothetical protein ACK52I_13615, partial [Pseudomonadota bacterium]
MAAVETMDTNDLAHRRARARRMTIVLALVAVAFYVAFLTMSVLQSRSRPPSRDWIPAPPRTPVPPQGGPSERGSAAPPRGGK